MKYLIGLDNFVKAFLLIILHNYQKISKSFAKNCRYSPSCSEYAVQAIKKYGTIGGIFLAAKRIIRCNQFFKGGYDPIP